MDVWQAGKHASTHASTQAGTYAGRQAGRQAGKQKLAQTSLNTHARTHLLDAEEVEAVLVRDEVDGQAQVAEAARPPDAVQVRLGRLFFCGVCVWFCGGWEG